MTDVSRRAVLILVLFTAGCASAGGRKSFADADTSCIRTMWWIEAPAWLYVGERAIIRIRRCEGAATPKSFAWTTSNWVVLGIVNADSNQVVVRGLARGRATITAVSETPPERSEVTVMVQ